jgi:lactoylglutathione lyase
MIRQLAHCCFYTDQIDQMVKFYQDSLGLPVQFMLNDDEGQVMGYYFACGNTTYLEVFDQALAIKQWGGKEQIQTTASRYKHLCLEVIGLDDYKKLLEERGVLVSDISLGMDHARQAWIADPDGNAIELMEYSHQSLQLQRP